MCFTRGLANDEFHHFTTLIKRQISLARGDYLHRMHTRFRNVYIVCTGSVKTYTLAENGTEQITAFHLPSEIVGLDSIGSRRHPSAAQALESTTLCEIPYARLETFAERITPVRDHLIRLMSEKILTSARHATLLGKKSAKARLARLLLQLSRRFRKRGCSAHEFYLSMSRTDIGNHLGLSTETISRLFTRFQEEGMIAVHRKRVRINDPIQLQHYADGTQIVARVHQAGA